MDRHGDEAAAVFARRPSGACPDTGPCRARGGGEEDRARNGGAARGYRNGAQACGRIRGARPGGRAAANRGAPAGFTLTELVVVMVIAAILSAFAISRIN